MSRIIAATGLFLLVGIAAACDKVPLLAPNESIVTLSIDSTTLGLNGTAELVATVIEPAGTPVHNGTVVTFITSLGTVEPREAQTQGGIARAIFRSGTVSGTARITAISGSSRSEPVEIALGGAAAERVTVRTEPATVPTSGGTVQAIAVVVDASGNPLGGAPVTFSSDFGTLSSNTATTGPGGDARVSLTTNRETIITASVAGKEGRATVRAVSPPVITITPSNNPIVGAPVTFTLSAAGGAGTPRVPNVVVDFGDGSPPVSIGEVPASPATKAISHVYNRADSYTVTATATDQEGTVGSSSIVVVVRRSTPTLSISVSPSSPIVNQPATVTVTISNPDNIRVQSLTVFFGNGTQAFLGAPQSGSQSASTVYTTTGTFTVRAELVDINGDVADVRTQIVVRAGL